MDEINNQKENRIKFLRLLYQKSGGDTRYQVEAALIGSELGFSDEETSKVVNYLADKGFLEYKTFGPFVSITVSGIEVIEDYASQSEDIFEMHPPKSEGVFHRILLFIKTQFSYRNFLRPIFTGL